MEYLSTQLTHYILKKGVIQKEDFEVYQYGFQSFLELSISAVCSIIIAFFLDMKPECVLFFLFFIPLRSYGGGLHLEHYYSCLFFSCITLITVLLLVKYCTVPILVSTLLYLIFLLLLKLVGPVNHPNREVDAEEDARFRKKTNLALSLSFLAAAFFLAFRMADYLFLEALVFILISVTALLGKLKYSS